MGGRVKSGSGRKADLTSVKDLEPGFWSHHLFPYVSRWRNSSTLIVSLVQVWRLGGRLNNCYCINWDDCSSLMAQLCVKVTGDPEDSSG